MLLFTNSQLCHFTNQAQGDRRNSKLMNFTKEWILYICFVINTKCQGYCTKKIDMTHLVKITIGLRYQRDPFVVMLPHKV